MATPELKQFGEAEDFERHPVWIGCHTADYGKPWYEDTDEETFRPYTGNLPADPAEGMLLVRAVVELHDGSRYPGFVTPAAEGWDKGPDGRAILKHNHILDTQQPQIFVRERLFGFWGGRVGIASQTQQELYAAVGKGPDAIFPLRFNADPASRQASAKARSKVFIEGIVTAFILRLQNSNKIRSSPKIPTVELGSVWEFAAIAGTHNQKRIPSI